MSNTLPSRTTSETALLQVRISRELRDEFMRVVKSDDDNASRLVRLWIREYLRQHSQAELFEAREL